MIIREGNNNSIKEAVSILRSGGIIAIPTDTVYGLACDASNDDAIKKLYQIKDRDISKAIAVFIKDLEEAKKIVKFNKDSLKIAKTLLPGPITLVLPQRSNNISNLLNKNDSTIGIRIPDHKFSLKLLENFGGILAVTSANISNKESAKSALEIEGYFQGKVELVIDGGVLGNKSSTIIKFNNSNIEFLREGLILKKEILSIYNNDK